MQVAYELRPQTAIARKRLGAVSFAHITASIVTSARAIMRAETGHVRP